MTRPRLSLRKRLPPTPPPVELRNIVGAHRPECAVWQEERCTCKRPGTDAPITWGPTVQLTVVEDAS